MRMPAPSESMSFHITSSYNQKEKNNLLVLNRPISYRSSCIVHNSTLRPRVPVLCDGTTARWLGGRRSALAVLEPTDGVCGYGGAACGLGLAFCDGLAYRGPACHLLASQPPLACYPLHLSAPVSQLRPPRQLPLRVPRPPHETVNGTYHGGSSRRYRWFIVLRHHALCQADETARLAHRTSGRRARTMRKGSDHGTDGV